MSVVRVRIEVAKSLGDPQARNPNFADSVRALIEARVDGILEQLGVPGTAQVAVGDFNHGRDDEFLRLFVNGQCCRYSRQCVERVHACMHGRPWRPLTREDLESWLREPSSGHEEVPRLAQFAAHLCEFAIKTTPEALLGDDQLEAFLAALRAENEVSEDVAAALGTVLPALLAQGISIGDARILESVRTALESEVPTAEAAEVLIAGLSGKTVEIHIAAAYLREMSDLYSTQAATAFPNMRDSLFYELGLRFPDAHFVPREDLAPRTFAFKVNDLLGAPWVGLAAGEVAVITSPDSYVTPPAREGFSAVVNPENLKPALLTNEKQSIEVDLGGLTTWRMFDFLAACMARELRWGAARLMTRDVVNRELENLEYRFPALVAAARGLWRDGQLAPAFRKVVAEEISVRNLPHVLMSVIDFDPIVTNSNDLIVFDERLPVMKPVPTGDPDALAATIRIALKRYISHKYTRGQATLVVYLMDPEIEKSLTQPGATGIGEERREKILNAVHEELGSESNRNVAPVILTTVEVRAALRALLVKELPQVAVLAYQELSPDLSIQPISRISLQ